MRALALAAGLLLAAPSFAQDSVSPLVRSTDGGLDAATVDSKIAAATASLATTSALSSMAATIPTPAATTPPGVTDAGAVGTQTGVYALANHTHASKARKGRVTTAANGTSTIALTPAFSATPICAVVAEATAGETNIVNAQLDGPPTASQLQVRVNRSAAQAVALLGLTINVVQTSVATVVDYICIEP